MLKAIAIDAETDRTDHIGRDRAGYVPHARADDGTQHKGAYRSPAEGLMAMYIFLPDQAAAMIDDLVASGLHGDSADRVAETLILDQLKFLMETPGWGRYFRDRRLARASTAETPPAPEPFPEPVPALLSPDDALIPF